MRWVPKFTTGQAESERSLEGNFSGNPCWRPSGFPKIGLAFKKEFNPGLVGISHKNGEEGIIRKGWVVRGAPPFRSFLNKKNGRLLMRFNHPARGMGSGLLGVSHHLACHRLDSSKNFGETQMAFSPWIPKPAPMGHGSFGRWRYRSSARTYTNRAPRVGTEPAGRWRSWIEPRTSSCHLHQYYGAVGAWGALRLM